MNHNNTTLHANKPAALFSSNEKEMRRAFHEIQQYREFLIREFKGKKGKRNDYQQGLEKISKMKDDFLKKFGIRWNVHQTMLHGPLDEEDDSSEEQVFSE